MRKINGQYIYSPSDLIVFMESQFDSWMDRYYLDYPDEVKPQAADDVAVILQKHGARYEGEFLASLEQQGKRSFCVSDFDRQCEEMTLNAMKEGYEVIYQGVLSSPQFAGKTDFLMKVPGASSFGDWSYEAWDTKLAKKPKPYFIVQLCCYAEMLEQIQGARPEKLTVVLGDKSTKDFRTNDFFYFYKQLKNSFLEFQAAFDKNNPPEAMEAGPFSRWADEAERRLEEADHLSRVANIRKIQIRKLKAGGIMTLEELATTSLTHVPKMEASTFNTLRQQAQLQMQTRREKKT
ncbi:MAG TPA: TM0106 family RecB-like putative nuclease, partial [Candidatus Obscuribacterales bacterium]